MLKLIPIILTLLIQPPLEPPAPCENRYGHCSDDSRQTEQTLDTLDCDVFGFCPEQEDNPLPPANPTCSDVYGICPDQGRHNPPTPPTWAPCPDSYGLCPANQPYTRLTGYARPRGDTQ